MKVELWIDGVRDSVIDWNNRIVSDGEGDDAFAPFEDQINDLSVGDEIDIGDGWVVRRVADSTPAEGA